MKNDKMTTIYHQIFGFRFQILVLIYLILPTIVFTQNGENLPYRQAGLWTEASFKYIAGKKWAFNLSEAFRLQSNTAIVDRHFTELKVKRTFWKKLELAYGYRYIFINEPNSMGSKFVKYNRRALSLSYDFKIQSFIIKTKVQSQNRRNILPKTNDNISDQRPYYRFRLGLKYPIKDWKFDPEIGFELFLKGLGHQSGQQNKYRGILKTQYKISNGQKIGLRYIYERELKSWTPRIQHVFDIHYTFTLKPKKHD